MTVLYFVFLSRHDGRGLDDGELGSHAEHGMPLSFLCGFLIALVSYTAKYTPRRYLCVFLWNLFLDQNINMIGEPARVPRGCVCER